MSHFSNMAGYEKEQVMLTMEREATKRAEEATNQVKIQQEEETKRTTIRANADAYIADQTLAAEQVKSEAGRVKLEVSKNDLEASKFNYEAAKLNWETAKLTRGNNWRDD